MMLELQVVICRGQKLIFPRVWYYK